MNIKHGKMRTVFVTKNYAYKIPTIKFDIKSFLKGWLSNIQEHELTVNEYEPLLCPVIKTYMFKFIIVMPKVTDILEISDEYFYFLIEDNIKKFQLHPELWYQDCTKENFGFLNNKFVKIDYGLNLRKFHSNV